MTTSHHDRRRALWRTLVCLAGVAGLFALTSPTASADCTSGGSGCLPGTGYAFDDSWNCGVIPTQQRCYYDSTTNYLAVTRHTWGWGSASYSGAGDVFVCIEMMGFFDGCGTNIARACYFANCNDQSTQNWELNVWNGGDSHTIWGHGKA